MQNTLNSSTSIKNTYKEHLWPFLLFVFIGIVFFIVVSQQNRQLYGSDISLMGFSTTFSEGILKTWNFPYWNAYINGGMPHMSALNSTMLFPSNLIMFLLQIPIQQMFLYSCVIAIILAGFFMYVFVNFLGFSKITASISGIFFCLSGSFITYINPGHDCIMLALVFLPASFYFITKGVKEDSLYNYILAGCMLAIQSLTIMYQMTYYTVLSLTAYFVFQYFTNKKNIKHIIYFLLTGLFVVLVSAIQLVQSLEYLKYSFRAGVNFEFFSTWSFHPMETIVYLYPKFFGFLEGLYWGRSQFWLHNDYLGILPLMLVFAGIYFAYKNKTMWFFVLMAAGILILAFGGFTPLHKILFKIPVVNGFRNSSRWLGFFSFSLIIVAAYGVEYILNYCREKVTAENAGRMKKFLLGVFASGGVALLIYLIFSSSSETMISKIKGFPQFSAKFQPKDQDFVSRVLYLMIKEDMLLLWIHLFSGLAFIYMIVKGWLPKGIVLMGCLLFVVMDNGLLFMQEHVYEVGGNQYKVQCIKTEPVDQEEPGRAEIRNFLSKDKSLYRVMPVGNLFNKNWFTADKIQSCGGYHNAPLENFFTMQSKGLINDFRFLSLLNAKYFLAEAPMNHPYLRLVSDGRIKIYQNTTVLPRSMLYTKCVNLDKEQMFLKMKEQAFDPLNVLILNEEFKEPLDNVRYTGAEVNISKYEENRIELETENSGNAMLFLSEVFYPEWKAYVDGKETKIYQAFGLFRTIYLPKGKHKVEFRWDPKVFYIGAITTLLTLIIVIILGIFTFRRKNQITAIAKPEISHNLKRK